MSIAKRGNILFHRWACVMTKHKLRSQHYHAVSHKPHTYINCWIEVSRQSHCLSVREMFYNRLEVSHFAGSTLLQRVAFSLAWHTHTHIIVYISHIINDISQTTSAAVVAIFYFSFSFRDVAFVIQIKINYAILMGHHK